MPFIVTDIAPGRTRNRPLKDYSGQPFGRLTAVRLVERDPKRNNHLWLFHCACGTEKAIPIRYVTTGHTSSCGCLHRELLAAQSTTHGLSRTQARTYRTWKDMRGRCLNPGDSDFDNYGGRGIGICEAWNDFAVFFADMGARPPAMTLDRIEVDGDYTPSNCRWATVQMQANNKRSNYMVEVNGVTQTLQQWCDEFGLERTKVAYRLAQGWPVEKAFSNQDFRKCP